MSRVVPDKEASSAGSGPIAAPKLGTKPDQARPRTDLNMDLIHAAVRPHVDSFDFFLNTGMERVLGALDPVVLVQPATETKMRLWVESVQVNAPESRGRAVLPATCRELGETYAGAITMTLCRSFGESDQADPDRITLSAGRMPIMLMSDKCHLRGKTPEELPPLHEESTEVGGYFVINGNERCVRLLISPKRNHVTGVVRNTLVNKGAMFTPFMTSVRCVRPDESAQTISMLYQTGGMVVARVILRLQEFFIPAPVLLRALVNVSDRTIFEHLTQPSSSCLSPSLAPFASAQAESMLSNFSSNHPSLSSRDACLAYLGTHFRPVLQLPPDASPRTVGVELLRNHFFVHLTTNREKFELMAFMIRKLYALAEGAVAPDNADSLDNHEVLLPGHLFSLYFRDRVGEMLQTVKKVFERQTGDWSDPELFRKLVNRVNPDLGRPFVRMLATGNLTTTTGLDLMQLSGYSISAEKLNYFRFLSHFRSIHRGSFFTELRTTNVRKLLPESWGFLCPVHTPDGSPCGLLNHLTQACRVLTDEEDSSALPAVLNDLGVVPCLPGIPPHPTHLTVLLDGRVVGSVSQTKVLSVASRLRFLKVTGHEGVPRTLEIVPVLTSNSSAYPGLFLFSGVARPVRDVVNLTVQKGGVLETISPLEQLYLTIACKEADFRPGSTTHQEIHPTRLLSVLASLTPFSDFNQSPRNMYQCQMCKQTMGTPVQAYPHRVDTKMYRINTPQRPIVRTQAYNEFGMDEFAMGTNAVVAVIAYTGYDMEDAMIINKSSMERGFMHGTVYTTKEIDLQEKAKKGEQYSFVFSNDGANNQDPNASNVEPDGLVGVGERVREKSVLCRYRDTISGEMRSEVHKGSEEGIVDQVRLLGDAGGSLPLQKVSIKLRFPRNPIIGDKFASRHGQKGVLSQLWNEADMPFSDGGIVPDILFNPHGFPSRMTIGMMIESICAKAGAMNGKFQDATPFQFSESERAVDYFAKQLAATGYSYYGTETLYSGVSGEPLECQIFMGIVYYQRLRHMVSDKFQVRAEGPVNQLTHQPVKGRKAKGGIRLGEMERDALLAHGSAFLLNDRLFNCSDFDTGFVCTGCGGVLSVAAGVGADHNARGDEGVGAGSKHVVGCRVCNSVDKCREVKMPYVFKYLVNELAAMNIKLQVAVE